MKIGSSLSTILAAAALILPSSLPAENGGPAGRWALHSEGRTLMILDLRRDRRVRGGWSGRLTRPFRARMTDGGTFFAIEGPVVHRAVRAVGRSGDGVELAAKGQRKGDMDLYVFRVVDGRGELSFKNVPMAPLILVPARPNETVDAGRRPRN